MSSFDSSSFVPFESNSNTGMSLKIEGNFTPEEKAKMQQEFNSESSKFDASSFTPFEQKQPKATGFDPANPYAGDKSFGDTVIEKIGFNENPNDPIRGLLDTGYRAGSGIVAGLGAPLMGEGLLALQKAGLDKNNNPQDIVNYVHAVS